MNKKHDLCRRNRKKYFVIALCTFIAGINSTEMVQAKTMGGDDELEYLKSLNIEDLLQTEVTSVSKKPEKLVDAAAAVFVITAEDIDRTGARTIPEALRMVPGLQVAQINSSKWAISSRGFGDLFTNNLLVMMDGRSVYTPLFSGVFWELQDTVMEDIDRIEIIRGPGATLWGANGVNGVINIITKTAKQTQGTLVSLGSGTSDPLAVAGRFGGQLGEDGHFRIYAKGDKHGANLQADGADAHDEWSKLQSGFRLDMSCVAGTTLTFQGEAFKGEEELTYNFPGLLLAEESDDDIDFSGGNLLGRWEREQPNDSVVTLQTYYDYSKIEAEVPRENRHTLDIDFQYKTGFMENQELIWGLGYRLSSDDIESNQLTSFDPESETIHLFSAFIQDEIELKKDEWWLTIGSKFEHNDFTGFEIQPNLRLRWKPDQKQTFWAAISRAVRTPSRAEHDLYATSYGGMDTTGNQFVASIVGQDDFESEELLAYEFGHRWNPSPKFSLDTALFYNVYDELRSLDAGMPYFDSNGYSSYTVLPIYIGNGLSADTYGVELLASWQPFSSWKLALGYSLLQVSYEGEATTDWSTQAFDEDDFPEHQIQLRSYLDLTRQLSFDAELYCVDELAGREVDAYVRLDLRLAWDVSDSLTLSINGENLLEDQHPEFGDSNSIIASEVPRQFFAKLTWSY